MKIVPLHSDKNIRQLIDRLIAEDRLAQKELYHQFSPKMLGVCRSYINDTAYAEDAMIKGFFKIFTKIGNYGFKGNFEGWMRKIMVNECLDFLRANKNLYYLSDDYQVYEEAIEEDSDLTGIDAQFLLDRLQDNYRIVFNLYVLEDYSHKEIAEMLNITEATSKSQLFRAKAKLKEIVLELKKKNYEA